MLRKLSVRLRALMLQMGKYDPSLPRMSLPILVEVHNSST